VLRGYRRLLVPLVDDPEPERAVELACRLAADRAHLFAVSVIEVPPLLPLDSHMHDQEVAARALLERAHATADSYGIGFAPRMPRAREAADEIVRIARAENVEVVVMGTGSSARSGTARRGTTLRHVLDAAPSRVMLVTPDRRELHAEHAA
jgi:nucleotide-binding universal stress UspA family protein